MLDTIFNKVAGLQACNFIKRDSNSGDFATFSRTPILRSICERLLLEFSFTRIADLRFANIIVMGPEVLIMG